MEDKKSAEKPDDMEKPAEKIQKEDKLTEEGHGRAEEKPMEEEGPAEKFPETPGQICPMDSSISTYY